MRDALAFHEEMLSNYGGLAGVRDQGLLESALHRPQQLHAYGKPTYFDLAAAYASGIIKNHPFLDGNKRAGFMAAALFLEINGYTFEATEEAVVINTLALAASEIDEADYAIWLKSVCRRPRRTKKPAKS
jgi:death-on-curing protein